MYLPSTVHGFDIYEQTRKVGDCQEAHLCKNAKTALYSVTSRIGLLVHVVKCGVEGFKPQVIGWTGFPHPVEKV